MEALCKGEEMSFKLAEQAIKFIRADRHSFLNHMQVILAYLQLGKYDRIKEYILEVSNTLQIQGNFMRELSPLLSLWICDKILTAQENDMAFSIDKSEILDNTCLELDDLLILEEKWQRIWTDNLNNKPGNAGKIVMKMVSEADKISVDIQIL